MYQVCTCDDGDSQAKSNKLEMEKKMKTLLLAEQVEDDDKKPIHNKAIPVWVSMQQGEQCRFDNNNFDRW